MSVVEVFGLAVLIGLLIGLLSGGPPMGMVGKISDYWWVCLILGIALGGVKTVLQYIEAQ